MPAPPKMEAIRTADVHTCKVELIDTPKPQAGEVLIRNKAGTLNVSRAHIEFRRVWTDS